MHSRLGNSLDCLYNYKIIVLLLCLFLPGYVQGALECKQNSKTVLERIPKVYPLIELITVPRINGSNNFFPNMTCTWNFTAPVGNIVSLAFMVIDYTTNKTVCQQDEIFDVFDGPSTSSNLLYNSCSNPKPSYVQKRFFTNGRYAVIEYKTPPNALNASRGSKFWGLRVSSFKKTTCMGGQVTNLTASTSTSNNITSPYYNYGYPTNSRCEWRITAPAGHMIKLEIMAKLTCDDDKLQISDPEQSNPNVEDFCSTSSEKLKISSGNTMHISFLSNSSEVSVDNRYFSVHYSAFLPVCVGGLTTNLTASTNTSKLDPDYTKLAKDSRCGWRITAPVGHLIKLEISTRLLCDTDNLQISDPDQNDFENIVCSTSKKTITSTGNVLLITFSRNASSNSQASFRYFRVDYTAFLPGTSCSPSNTADQNQNIIIRAPEKGTIQSYNFPNKFPANLDCKWKVIAPAGYSINLYMGTININGKYGCSLYPYLRIFDGLKDRISPYIANAECRYSYQRLQHSFYAVSSGNKMRIEFKSGSVEPTGYGFQANYTFQPLGVSGSCGEGRTGTIKLQGQGASFFSPGYQFMDTPQHPKDMTCIWNITVDPGYTILLSAKRNYLKVGCSSEYTKVYDGTSLSGKLLGTMCEGKDIGVLYSSGNNMIVEMKTASSDQRGKGILMTFRAVKYEKFDLFYCTSKNPSIKIENKETATVMSPWFPVEYPNNARCLYMFDAPFASIAKVNITILDMQESDKCQADRLRVTGSQFFTSPERAVFCGKKDKPIHMTSSGRRLMIDFMSNWRYGQYPGFKAVFYSTEDESFGPCRIPNKDNVFQMNASSGGFLFSPRYPKDIPPNMMCTWVITAPEGQHARLDFHHFDLDYTCSGKSQLEIRDGASSTSKKLGTYCKKDAPESIFSSGRHLWVRFTSVQGGVVDKGFNASYGTVGTLPLSVSCSDSKMKKIVSSSGEFASHNYPLNYANNMECTWQITVPDGKRVKLTFKSFNLEGSSGCSSDFVEVFDGMTKYAESLGKFCGGTKPEPIYSDGTWMYIHFKSNGVGQYPGFDASFEAVLSVKSILMIVFFTLIGVGALCSIIGWCLKSKVYSHDPDPSPPGGAGSTAGSNMELTSKM